MYGEQTTIAFAPAQVQTRSMEQIAKDYLLNKDNPHRVRVVINGENRTIFVNNREGDDPVFGILHKGGKTHGRRLFDNEWAKIEKVILPSNASEEERRAKLIAKYKKLASTATFTNSFIRDIKEANYTDPLYKQGLNQGGYMEGTCVNLSTIKKHCYFGQVEEFLDALHNHKDYSSERFDFQGYDGTLWTRPYENGDIMAGFSKEFRNCGNGYYYLLINDDTFIFYDKD